MFEKSHLSWIPVEKTTQAVESKHVGGNGQKLGRPMPRKKPPPNVESEMAIVR